MAPERSFRMTDILIVEEKVELLKSIRSSGVILEAGMRGIVISSAGGQSSKVQFEDSTDTYEIVNRYLRFERILETPEIGE
jgi:hypothetical protein